MAGEPHLNKLKLYHKYHIETETVENIASYPSRFRVKINRWNLARLLLKELIHYRGKLNVIKSAPCVYGVFSGPIGGFAPREEKCVGCLRCTTQYPDVASIFPNPSLKELGDSYFTPQQYDTAVYEAKTGLIPVKGAGYRGAFGGKGWDQMWTDMSEIVRPTRDGIHGREFISTEVDIGGVFPHLTLDSDMKPQALPHNISLPIPLIFDLPPKKITSKPLLEILSNASNALQTLAIFPLEEVLSHRLEGNHIVPSIRGDESESLKKLSFIPKMVELMHWDKNGFDAIRSHYPDCLIALRASFQENLLTYQSRGINIFHLTADYHGRASASEFILEGIRRVHLAFVKAKCRDQVTLIGSGGITSAEHIPKAIIAGLDLIALNTPLMAALQATFVGECTSQQDADFSLPAEITSFWGIKRVKNLINAWRDQLLEIMGAMGLREVRRLRGEIGRAMLQKECEDEAFFGIEGYERKGQ